MADQLQTTPVKDIESRLWALIEVVSELDPTPTEHRPQFAQGNATPADLEQIKLAVAQLEEVRISMVAQVLEQLSNLTASLKTLRQVSANISDLVIYLGLGGTK